MNHHLVSKKYVCPINCTVTPGLAWCSDRRTDMKSSFHISHLVNANGMKTFYVIRIRQFNPFSFIKTSLKACQLWGAPLMEKLTWQVRSDPGEEKHCACYLMKTWMRTLPAESNELTWSTRQFYLVRAAGPLASWLGKNRWCRSTASRELVLGRAPGGLLEALRQDGHSECMGRPAVTAEETHPLQWPVSWSYFYAMMVWGLQLLLVEKGTIQMEVLHFGLRFAFCD